MSDTPTTIRERAIATKEAGATLRAASMAERAEWLAKAAQLLEAEAIDAADVLSKSTGLSASMVRWAALTTLETVNLGALRALGKAAQAANPGRAPIEMLSVILAGNLFTASVRGIFVPLLLGVPVLVKASSRETRFPSMLQEALRRADFRLGRAMERVTFRGGDPDCEAALLEPAEAVSVYGSDETMRSISERLGDSRLIAHGHGVSVEYCGKSALDPVQLSDTVAALALDICAYDQRGCLSPQLIYVEESPVCSAEDLAESLGSNGLEPVNGMLPRGPLPLSLGAAQTQWRGLAEVEGKLIRGDSYAIAVRPVEPVRWSPGYRNITIAPVEGVQHALQSMRPFGASLKCVGADPHSLAELHAELARTSGLNAYACAAGQMQTPKLDAPADGRPIWHGLLRAQTPMKRR